MYLSQLSNFSSFTVKCFACNLGRVQYLSPPEVGAPAFGWGLNTFPFFPQGFWVFVSGGGTGKFFRLSGDSAFVTSVPLSNGIKHSGS